ncbi:hypothetical protein MJ585_28065 [Klebsiella pneumoniae]|nr:hypothetical protein MJ585_28065 [Klebsiella pneumoniae]
MGALSGEEGKSSNLAINDFGHLGVKPASTASNATATVHYLVATVFHGEQPEGLLIRHLDGRPPKQCALQSRVVWHSSTTWLTPLHTIPLSLAERRYNAKPTNEVVIAIRIKKSEGALNKDLAAEYGLTELYIHHIVTG